MDARTLLLGIMVLACPIAMGLMMWMMSKNMGKESGHSMPGDSLPADPRKRLADLQARREGLEAEIAEYSRIVELEARREALREGQSPAAGDSPAPASR